MPDHSRFGRVRVRVHSEPPRPEARTALALAVHGLSDMGPSTAFHENLLVRPVRLIGG